MTRTTLGTLVGLAIASLVAWQLGGSLGLGVMVGFVFGATITGLTLLYQRRVMLSHPGRLMQAMLHSFLFKLAVLLLGALSLRFIQPAAERADWRSFLVAFAGAALIVLILGTLDNLRTLKEGRSL